MMYFNINILHFEINTRGFSRIFCFFQIFLFFIMGGHLSCKLRRKRTKLQSRSRWVEIVVISIPFSLLHLVNINKMNCKQTAECNSYLYAGFFPTRHFYLLKKTLFIFIIHNPVYIHHSQLALNVEK